MSPSETETLAQAAALKEKGLQALGYVYVNLDDGIVSGRMANGTLIPDPTGFPRGMRALSDELHSQSFLFGIYTDRGPKTVRALVFPLGVCVPPVHGGNTS